MNRPAALCAALAVTLQAAPLDTQQPEFRDRVQPVLVRHCYSCHGGKVQSGGLDLQRSDVPAAAWEKVLDRVTTGRMPPPGLPKLSKGDLALVTGWLERGLAGGPALASPRVTARRLNRAEYNNTIRDLLGVSLRPADDFPLDDAGYGFDNIGDVLSVSPLLLEKYMAAARRVSQVAVFGETYLPKPTKLVRFMTKKSQDDPTPNALPYSYRGAIYGSFVFPVEGDYELRMRVGNYRPREKGTPRHQELSRKRNRSDAEQRELDELNRKAYPPVEMVVQFDGKPVLSEVVEGNIDFQYAHGESIARVHATAGEHFFRASFPEFADMENVRDNVNLDGRRKLFLDYVDIIGPYTPAAAKPASYRRLFVCADQSSQCSRQIIESLLRRAYRRPATPADVDKLAALAAQVRDNGDSFDESIRVVVQAVLVSPRFLFRVENDTLDAYDIASRLSYFLWSSMPDEPLLRAAASGGLLHPPRLHAELRRMLRDPRADALMDNFAGQWLGLRTLDKRKPDPAAFPTVDDELLEAMRQETSLFARAVLREDRSVLEFLDGGFTYLNGPLARHYGIPGVRGEAMQRVAMQNPQRSGVITQGAVLALSSYATRTSPVLRGKWVLDNLLGTPPPPAPPEVPAFPETGTAANASLRQRLEQHRANPSCAVCHDLMDPIGFGLENYDASGKWRDNEGHFPIDASGKLRGGAAFRGPRELKSALKGQSDLFVRNLTEKLLTYALGRGVERADRKLVDAILARLAAEDNKFSTLVREIVNSQAFLTQPPRVRETGGTDAGGR
ncbi:MAG: DUF1592 domain-containing protein [Bryobacterales bacterium]|nr:DUF1592 domain-containing protein [Bryobacterales bacterium]